MNISLRCSFYVPKVQKDKWWEWWCRP